jgi:hypothetical protein
MNQQFFRIEVILYSNRLPVISDILGKSAGDGVVFGSTFIRQIVRDQMPSVCQEFFKTAQMTLPFEGEK